MATWSRVIHDPESGKHDPVELLNKLSLGLAIIAALCRNITAYHLVSFEVMAVGLFAFDGSSRRRIDVVMAYLRHGFGS